MDCQTSFVTLAPADYQGINVDRDFAIGTGLPGQTRFCRNIDINDDNLAEGLEESTYQLVSLNNELVEVNPSRSTADIQIQDDDSKSAHIVGVHCDEEFAANHLQLLSNGCSEGSLVLNLNIIEDILFPTFYKLILRVKILRMTNRNVYMFLPLPRAYKPLPSNTIEPSSEESSKN